MAGWTKLRLPSLASVSLLACCLAGVHDAVVHESVQPDKRVSTTRGMRRVRKVWLCTVCALLKEGFFLTARYVASEPASAESPIILATKSPLIGPSISNGKLSNLQEMR